MGRLKAAPARLSTPKPYRIRQPDGPQERDKLRNEQAWRKLYHTTRWRRLRWSILTRDLFTCQRCRTLVADTSKLVCDHRRPHRGDEAMFWDEGNLQTLCSTCHSGAKQREEQSVW